MSYTLLVNKSHTLSSSYVPPYLTEARIPFHAPAHHEKTLMEKAAAKSAAKLPSAAAENVTLMGISGYRSYRRQEALYRNALQRGSTAVAPPGTSEHQTGLALDISCASLNFELEESFAATKEGKWLKSNAPLYGFILRYPRRKEHITGYPWELAHTLCREDAFSLSFPHRADFGRIPRYAPRFFPNPIENFLYLPGNVV